MPSSPPPSHPPERRRCILIELGWESIELLRGILQYAKEHGMAVVHPRGPLDRPERLDLIDGVIGAFSANASIVPQLHRVGLPVVDLANAHPELKALRLCPDNHAIGRMAFEHFRGRGFRRMVAMEVTHGWASLARCQAFAAVAGTEDVDCRILSPRAGGFTVENPSTRLATWLRKMIATLPDLTAVFCPNDDLARFVMNLALESGRKIPEDLALLGVDNDPMVCDFALVPLSSIDIDLFQLGYRGTELLAGLIQGERPPRQPEPIPPVGLVTRKSTDVLATDDPVVRRAIGFIRNHFRDGIVVEDVLEGMALSRTRFYQKFREETGRTVGSEIRRLQIAEARRLLAATNEKLYTIARESGFNTLNSFCRTFKSEVGMTPGAYRKAHAAE